MNGKFLLWLVFRFPGVRSGWVAFSLALSLASVAFPAPLRLAGVFSDHMVLQRDAPVTLWGWADPGSRVLAQIAGRRAGGIADAAGRWQVRLGSRPAGGPYVLEVRDSRSALSFRDVLFGDVWLCSGQSNMEMSLRPAPDGVFHAEQEVAAADYQNIRLFTVPQATAFTPRADLDKAGWQICGPRTAVSFSALAYFFGREMLRHRNVPLGLIHSSKGASTAEAWTSAEALRRMPEYRQFIEELPDAAGKASDMKESYEKKMADWTAGLDSLDQGYLQNQPFWSRPQLDDREWQTMNLPQYWEDAGFPDLDGFMWYRKKVEIPAKWKGRPLQLGLCTINDMDRVWFEGTMVGRFESPSGWTAPRRYEIPAALVRPGPATIAIRVYDVGSKGGLCGLARDMWLRPAGGGEAESIPLPGPWLCRPGLDLRNAPPRPEPPFIFSGNQRVPTVLFNAMIAPLIPYRILGVLWYQGESNAGRAGVYCRLMTTMIEDWRRRWRQGDFPFLYVQLPSYGKPKDEPGDDAWAELREAQTKLLRLPRTAMAVTIDLGEAGFIHPRNKKDVAGRLALLAREMVFGEKVAARGPAYRSMRISENEIRIRFDHAGRGITTRDGAEPKGFAVAGEDRRFHWARARMDGDQIVVFSPSVPRPVAVRYGWETNPPCNVYGRSGLPLAPFRSDSWPPENKP